MSGDLYILGDADRVRDRIEGLLLGAQPADVRGLSTRLATGLAELVRSAEALLEAEVLMAGGDEVLFRMRRLRYCRETLADIGRRYEEVTSCPMSFGVGTEVATAYLNLRRAKAQGGGTIVDDLATP